MRYLTLIFLIACTACGQAPKISTSTNAKAGTTVSVTQAPAIHNYSLTLSGGACQVAATVITPSNGQVIDPAGGGIDTIPAGVTRTISISGTTGDAQISEFGGCLQVHGIFYKDGVQIAERYLGTGESWDSGAL